MKFFAFLMVAIAVVYADPGHQDTFRGWILPILGTGAAVFLLRIWGTISLALVVLGVYHIDFASDRLLVALGPLVLIGLGIGGLVVWAWRQGWVRGRRHRTWGMSLSDMVHADAAGFDTAGGDSD